MTSFALATWLATGMPFGLALQPVVAAAPAPTPATAVVLLPFVPDGSVTLKQARGLAAQLRSSVEAGAYVKLLSQSKDDEKQAERCRTDPKCLARIADLRGADLLLAGSATPAPDGLRISVVVVRPASAEPVRRVEVTIQGNDRDAHRFDRLGRAALAPEALRGSLVVVGERGASVEVDGRAIGTLPLSGPVGDLVEGDHIVVVRKSGWDDSRRQVAITHDETTEVKVVLLAARTDPRPDQLPDGNGDAGNDDAGNGDAGNGAFPVEAIVAGSIGGGLVLLGGVAGTLSLLDSLDVEKRAAAQQLTFPQDSGLVLRGQVFAWTANALYAAGAIGLAAGGVLWLLPGGGEAP